MSDAIRTGVDPRVQASFSLRNRLGRALWGVVAALLVRPSPRPCHRWRAFWLRRFGARLGRGCHVYPRVRIWAPWNLVMDDDAAFADDVICYNIAPVTIGRRAVVSQGAHLCTGSHDYEDPDFQLIARPITIGAEAWICAEAFVGPGVTIGAGAVLAARAVATRDATPWMIHAGVPARPLKPRVLRPRGTP